MNIKHKDFLNTIPYGMAHFFDNKIVFANRAFLRLIGTKKIAVIQNQSIETLIHPDDRAIVANCVSNIVSKKKRFLKTNVRLICLDGNAVHVEMTLKSAVHEEVGVVQVFLHDISQVKKLESDAQLFLDYDARTGLLNRDGFRHQLNHCIAQARSRKRRFTLFYLDIDHFKLTNESLGFEVGDHFLQLFAERLKANLRKEDIAARIGSDQFAIILNDVNRRTCIEMANMMLSSLSHIFIIKNKKIYVTVSIGICSYPTDGADSDTLLKNADIALYHAKQSGRHCYQFAVSGVIQTVQSFWRLAGELQEALIKNQFYLVYQPVINIKTNKIIYIETLIRWHHPKHGLIMPNDFIPITEGNGLIARIDQWVLRETCQFCKNLAEGIVVSVNCSPVDFQSSYIVNAVREILKQQCVSPQRICIEITERLFFKDAKLVIKLLNRLSRFGVKIALDDFGMHYASFQYLKLFHCRYIKIDQYYITNITSSRNDLEIVKAIVTMGHSLKKIVIAEGVENREQFDLLKQIGCDAIQGYFYTKPLSQEKMMKFLKKRR